jgi:hypothetical protein
LFLTRETRFMLDPAWEGFFHIVFLPCRPAAPLYSSPVHTSDSVIVPVRNASRHGERS